MEKKASVKDVYRHISHEDYSELYKTLTGKLGDESPFAKFSTGAGFYEWSDSRCQWHCMANASELKQTFINEAFLQLRETIGKKIGEKTAEALFTTPDNSYIYYNDEAGEIKILITGWGFKKPVRTSGKGDIEDLPVKNPVTLSFKCDGEVLTNYKFGLRLANQVKRLTTGPAGAYEIPDIKVGEKFVVTDFNTKKDYPLEIVEGQSLYVLDVTHYATVGVDAKIDGKPLAGENTQLVYHAKFYDAVTDENGQAQFRIPFYEGETATVSMRDKKENVCIESDSEKVEFNFELNIPEIPVVPKVPTEVKVVVEKNGQPMATQPVTVAYGDNTINGMTDNAGTFTTQVEEIQGEMCSVSTPGYETQSKLLDDGTQNVFLFETEEPPQLPGEIKFMLRDCSGNPIVCNNITVAQENKPELVARLDENGNTTLPEGRFETGTPVSLKINGWNKQEHSEPINFTLEKDEYEYLIQEKEPQQNDWQKTALEILAVVAAAVLLLWPTWPLFEKFCAAMFRKIYF